MHAGAFLAVAFFMLAIQGATAQTRTIAQAGGWTAFGGITNDNNLTCGVDASDRETGRHFLLQWYSPNNYLTARMIKRSWSIPRGTDIPVALRIDSGSEWTATAIGSEREITWHVQVSNLDRFIEQFRRGMQMSIAFLSGNEPPWRFNLVGSNAIMNAFVRCLQLVNPTQPFASGPAQPYQPRPQAPTQPFSVPLIRKSDAASPAVGPGRRI